MKKESRNEFMQLRQEGVFGTVVSRDYSSKTVLSSMKESLMILTGEIEPGKWDYGYIYQRPEFKDERKLPGEGGGWFRSQKDAYIYALGELKTKFPIGSDPFMWIDREITRNISPTLF